jgi:hypothetical protein
MNMVLIVDLDPDSLSENHYSTDILQTLQASLSTSSPLLRRDGLGSVPALDPLGGSHSPSHSHLRQEEEELREGNSSKVLARLMDWVEARQVSHHPLSLSLFGCLKRFGGMGVDLFLFLFL